MIYANVNIEQKLINNEHVTALSQKKKSNSFRSHQNSKLMLWRGFFTSDIAMVTGSMSIVAM